MKFFLVCLVLSVVCLTRLEAAAIDLHYQHENEVSNDEKYLNIEDVELVPEVKDDYYEYVTDKPLTSKKAATPKPGGKVTTHKGGKATTPKHGAVTTPKKGGVTTPKHGGGVTTPKHGAVTTPKHGAVTTPKHGAQTTKKPHGGANTAGLSSLLLLIPICRLVLTSKYLL